MNFSRTAIRYELSCGSAATLLRLYLRILLLWILIWAASDLFFVWYWTGRVSGLGAHQYFGRWILAWFFTQKVPLYFLSLPYRGGRATIGSMYLYLNWRFYLGRSFGQWFASYSVWGAVPASLAYIALGYFILHDPEDRPEGKHLRGLRLIHRHQLSSQLRRTGLRADPPGVELARVRIPRSIECEHFLITGATGAGKSMAIRSLLRQIQARGELAIVVDPECEYLSEFYRPLRGDLILNPVDERCPYWSPWLELSERYYQADAATLAASLIPEPPRGYESGSDHFFRQSSRTLLESLLQVATPREPQSIPKLLELTRDQLKQALSGTPAYSLIDPGAHEQGAGMIATVANATRSLLYLPPADGRLSWSALEWSEHPEGWLFVTMRDESNSAALPLANLWLDLIVGRLLNSASDRRRVWIVVDELPVLGRQAKLETLVTRGRKRGLAAVLGFQSIAQLRRIYGHEQAAVLASMPSTKLLLRVDEPETATFIARQIGEREALREEIGISTAEHGNRYNLHPARRTEPVVMASEVQRLPKLEGYLCIAGLDRARVKVKPCVPRRRQVEFIPRALPRPVIDEPGADLATLTISRPPTPPNGTAGAPVRIQD
ncbi:MAG: type IV secretion system DNA-binding domain-containing protein [Candidatus Binataceae bacterium]|nr:type IV secretion system DNA-binding domain-containing protein [Candidatus Binataceae bacterium]